MPLLGVLLGNLMGGFVAFLSAYFTRKIAFGVAIGVAFSFLTAALLVLFRATLVTINTGMTGAPVYFMQGIGLAVTPGVISCVSLYATTWAACTAYTWQRDLLYLAAQA